MPTVTIPEDTYRQLAAKAAAQNTTVDDLAARLLGDGKGLSKLDLLLDHEYHAECEADTDPVPTLEEVRAALASIPGDMTADFIAERDER